MTAAILALALAAAPFNSPGIVGPRGATGVIVGGDEEGNVLIDGGTLWVSDGAAHNMITLGKDGTITAGQVNATGLSTDGGAGLVILDGTGHVVATISASGTEWLANTLGVDGGVTVKGSISITNGAGTTKTTLYNTGEINNTACDFTAAGSLICPPDYSGMYFLSPTEFGSNGWAVNVPGSFSISAAGGSPGNLIVQAPAGAMAVGALLGSVISLAQATEYAAPFHHWLVGAGTNRVGIGDVLETGVLDAGSAKVWGSLTVAGVGVVGGAPLSMNGYQLAALGTGVAFGCTKAPSAGHVRTATYTPQIAGSITGSATVGVYDGSTELCEWAVSCNTAAGTSVSAPAGNCDDGGATQAYVAGDVLCFQLKAETCSVSNPTGDASAQGN